VTRTVQIAQTIANLAGTATGFADAIVRYLVLIKADADPADIRAMLERAFEAFSHLQDTMESLMRLAPNAAKAGEERAATVREGLKI
jgi:hypothetical protein